MKYAFLILFSAFSFSSYARTINSFNDSQAIVTIANFMFENAEDLPVSTRISDKKLKLDDTSNCKTATTSEILNEVWMALNTVLKFYPDEELPTEEALNDLADYLGNDTYKKCTVFQSNNHLLVSSTYFFNTTDTTHVKVDTITLINH